MDPIFEALAEPFPPESISWRVGATNAKSLGVKPWEATKGIALAYIDARDVMDRLDDVVGHDSWSDTYTETASGRVLCALTIKLDHIYTTKSDGAGDTGTEGAKGAISDAFKRAAVKWGIGRYLYGIKAPWCDLENGKLPKSFDGSQYLKAHKPYMYIRHADSVKANWDSVVEIKGFLANDMLPAAWEAWNEIDEEHQIALRMAPTKGAIWTIEENNKLKQAALEDFDSDAGVYKKGRQV